VNGAIVQDLLEAADMLQLRHVVNICCSFLLQQLHESNSIGLYTVYMWLFDKYFSVFSAVIIVSCIFFQKTCISLE